MEKQPAFDLTSLLQKERIESLLNPNRLGHSIRKPSLSPERIGFPFEKEFSEFLESLVNEQFQNAERLLSLNPSRRESLGKFLSELAKQPEPENPQQKLKEFISPNRSPQAHEALRQLFRQIAMAQLGKALLVSSWTKDPFSKNDLKNLTAAIEKGMRAFLNLQTSSSQLIQRNFYSWYTLSEGHQETLWNLLNLVRAEDPELSLTRNWLFCKARKLSAETLGERDRYSKNFYQYLWKSIESQKLLGTPLKNSFGFSPTLRDGCIMEFAPKTIEWIGFEALSFELLFCEIRYLWGKPGSLPLWIKGNSLEMNMDLQSSLILTHSGKQNTLNQIENITSCEIAIVAEENQIRTQSKTLAGQALRKLVDQHHILKKIKQPQTTRGMYQVCQSLEKLRQNGLLIWARDERLDEASGKPALQHILNHSKVLLVADLNSLHFSDPEMGRDLPKTLYVLQKEIRMEERKGHRPLLIKTYGEISSGDEVQLLLERIFTLIKKPELVFPPEPFQIHSRISPIEQREWEQHWFNPADDQMVDQIEKLKRKSSPLGELATVKMVSFTDLLMDPNQSSIWKNLSSSPYHFFIWSEARENGNVILTATKPEQITLTHKKQPIFMVYPIHREWDSSLQSLLLSHHTRNWLNYSAERKKGSWMLGETDIKSIPVPAHIYEHLKSISTGQNSGIVNPLEKKIMDLIPTRPAEALRLIEKNREESGPYKGGSFVLASKVLERQKSDHSMLFKLVQSDGRIHQEQFESIVLKEGDLVAIHQHPLIRFNSTLSPHLAITHITESHQPLPGIMMATSKGLTQFLHIQDPKVRELTLEKLNLLTQEISEPTWHEICDRIRIPKDPDQFRKVSQQILDAFQIEKMRKKELVHLIEACLIDSDPTLGSSKVNLLQ